MLFPTKTAIMGNLNKQKGCLECERIVFDGICDRPVRVHLLASGIPPAGDDQETHHVFRSDWSVWDSGSLLLGHRGQNLVR